MDYCAFKNGNRSPLKIQEIERKDGVVPRYHLEALKFLISNGCFDVDAVPVVEKMVSALAVKQTTTLEASKRKVLRATANKKQRSIIEMMTIKKRTTPSAQTDAVQAVALDETDPSDLGSDSGTCSSSNSDEIDI